MNMRLLRALAVLALVLCCGCDTTRPVGTQLLVVVSSDLTPRSELAEVRLSVDGSPALALLVSDAADASPADAGTKVSSLPFSFGVLPPDGDASRTVLIEADARGPDGQTWVRSTARVGFVRGQRRVLTLRLDRVCAPVFARCGEQLTCRDGSCVPVAIDVASLPVHTEGHEFDGVSRPGAACLDCTDASAPDAGADASTDASIMRGGDKESPRCGASPGYAQDIGRKVTTSQDDRVCPFEAHSQEWGYMLGDAQQSAVAVRKYVEVARAVQADVVSLSVALVDGTLQTIGDPPPTPHGTAMRVDLEPLLDNELLQAEQVLQLVVSEPVADPLAMATRLLETLRARLQLSGTVGLVRPCRPVYLRSEGHSSFLTLAHVATQLRDNASYRALSPLVHLGARLFGPEDSMYGQIDDAKDVGLELVSFEVLNTSVSRALTYASRRGLATSLFTLLDPDMAANLCGLTDTMQLLVRERAPGLEFQNATPAKVRTSLALIDLDARALAAGEKQLVYRGLPEPRTRTVVLGPGDDTLGYAVATSLPEDHDGAALHFDASKRQSLALHNAGDGRRNEKEPDNPYAKLTLSVVVRLGKPALQVGEHQVIISKRQGNTGWALELSNQGAGTGFRLVQYGLGLEDKLIHVAEAFVSSANGVTLDDEKSYLVYGQMAGNYVRLWVQNQEAKTYFTDPPQGMEPRTSEAPVTLGADPGATASFFDGDIQLVRLVSML